MGLRIRDRKTSIAIVFLIMVVIGAALVTIAPKMSMFSRSFCNECAGYEELLPGQSVKTSFITPFDRLTGITVDFESIGDTDLVGQMDAVITLADSEGNILYEHDVSSIYESSFDTGVIPLSADEVYSLALTLDAVYGNASPAMIGVTDDGSLNVCLEGLNNGAPTKSTFIVLYVVTATMILAYVYTYGQDDIKKTALIDKIIFGIAVFIAIAVINQFYDLFMTSKYGLRLIDAVKTGNIFNYYNVAYYGELETGSPSMFFEYHYNIFAVLPLAVLMIPFSFFTDGNMGFSIIANIIVLYMDAVVAGLVIWSVKLTERICDACSMPREYKRSVQYVYAFSPVLLCITIASGQVDIIYILVMLWALPFYYRKKYRIFSFIMAFTVTMKLLPLLAFIPMILLVNKKIKDILINALICLSVKIGTLLLFERGDGYNAIMNLTNDRYSYMDKLFENRIGNSLSLFLLVFVAVCIVCYMKNIDPDDRKKTLYYSMTIIFAVYTAIAAFVDWHEQWLIPLILSLSFLIPFFGKDRRLIIIAGVMETLIMMVSEMMSSSLNMVQNGLLCAPEYDYAGITVFGVLENITPHAGPILLTMLAASSLYLVYFFVSHRNETSEVYTADRTAAVGRIFVFYIFFLTVFWCYSYVG